MKRDNLIMYLIEISLVIFLLCCIFWGQIFSKIIIGIVLLVFMIISNNLVKSDKIKGKYNKKVTATMTIIGLIYIAIMYMLGIYIGFYNATVKLSLWSLINYIIPYIVIIISTENIRKTILLKEDKKSNIVIFLATVILDVAITTNIYNVKTLGDYYMLIGFVMFTSIANNMLYNYIIKKHRNCKAIIIYRIITTIYVYIIPIIPNMHILFESIIRIIVPYIIFLILEKNTPKIEKKLTTSTRTKDIAITTILACIAAGFVMLISCKFKYGILVIGSGSMTGTINKGDAIIYKKLDKDEQIEIEDIIVFQSENIRIIHRVIDKKDTGTEIKYYTKGDANSEIDEGYRIEDDIIGMVKAKIPYIGEATLMLNEIFK